MKYLIILLILCTGLLWADEPMAEKFEDGEETMVSCSYDKNEEDLEKIVGKIDPGNYHYKVFFAPVI